MATLRARVVARGGRGPGLTPAHAMRRFDSYNSGLTAPRVMARFNQGDPGIFSSIGKFIGGAVKTVSGVVSGLGIPIVSGVAGTVNRLATAVTGGGMQQTSVKGALQGPQIGPGIGVQLPRIGPGGIDLGGFQAGYLPQTVAQGTAMVPAGNACAIRGTHTNKSRYRLVNSGELVERGSRCVKNRRMNPLNPRALNRAMRRIKSAKSAARFLDRIHIGGRPSRGSRRSVGGCGCKSRKR